MLAQVSGLPSRLFPLKSYLRCDKVHVDSLVFIYWLTRVFASDSRKTHIEGGSRVGIHITLCVDETFPPRRGYDYCWYRQENLRSIRFAHYQICSLPDLLTTRSGDLRQEETRERALMKYCPAGSLTVSISTGGSQWTATWPMLHDVPSLA